MLAQTRRESPVGALEPTRGDVAKPDIYSKFDMHSSGAPRRVRSCLVCGRQGTSTILPVLPRAATLLIAAAASRIGIRAETSGLIFPSAYSR